MIILKPRTIQFTSKWRQSDKTIGHDLIGLQYQVNFFNLSPMEYVLFALIWLIISAIRKAIFSVPFGNITLTFSVSISIHSISFGCQPNAFRFVAKNNKHIANHNTFFIIFILIHEPKFHFFIPDNEKHAFIFQWITF